MAQQDPSRTNPQDPAPLDGQTIREFIKIQQQQAQNDAKELEIKQREVDNSFKFAMKSLELQAEVHKSRPESLRRGFKTIGNYVIFVIILFFVFCGFCIYLDQTDFLMKFLQGCGYLVTTALGYFLGKKRTSKLSKDDDPEVLS